MRKPRRARSKPPNGERARLLDAGPALARRLRWDAVTPAAVSAAAAVPAAALRREFGGLTGWLVALQQRFMDGLRDGIVARTQAMPTSEERLRAAAEVYLDGCLAQHALRSWFVAARTRLPALADGLKRQNHVYGLLLLGEFRKLGWAHPAAAARLYLAMLMEAGLAEQAAGRPLPELRAALWDHLRHGG